MPRAPDDRVLRSIIEGDDDAYGHVVVEQATKVIRTTGLPRPDGGAWTDDDAWDLASEFFTKRKAVETALLAAADDDSLRGYLYTVLENQIRQTLRRATKARLKRRLKELLAEEGWVETPAGFWSRPQDSRTAFSGRDAELQAVAWSIEVKLVKWRDDAQRNSPFAERESLMRLLDTIGETARGAIHLNTITDIVARRLGLSSLPTVEALDLSDEANDVADPTTGPEAEVAAQEAAIDAAAMAVSIFGDLSPDQRRMIPYTDESVRDAGEQLGWGKTKAGRVQNRLKATYEATLSDLSELERLTVLDELVELERPSPSDLGRLGEDS